MTTRTWMDQGTAVFLEALAEIDDEQLERNTSLPGWTGRHLVAHIHFNALALGRLATWAVTGVENRMYGSAEQRHDEIERGARLPPAELRELVQTSAGELASTLDSLSPQAWQATVVTAQGRTVPATEIPWMRTREVYIHAIDLGGSATFDTIPADVIAAILADVLTKRSAAGEAPALAAWLTGRTAQAPALGPWL